MFEQFDIENGLIIGNRNSMEMKVEGMVSNIFTSEGRNNMRLIEVILDDKNLNEAVKRVKRNKGVAGVGKMTVYEIDTYFQNNKERIKKEILEKKYRPQPIARATSAACSPRRPAPSTSSATPRRPCVRLAQTPGLASSRRSGPRGSAPGLAGRGRGRRPRRYTSPARTTATITGRRTSRAAPLSPVPPASRCCSVLLPSPTRRRGPEGPRRHAAGSWRAAVPPSLPAPPRRYP